MARVSEQEAEVMIVEVREREDTDLEVETSPQEENSKIKSLLSHWTPTLYMTSLSKGRKATLVANMRELQNRGSEEGCPEAKIINQTIHFSSIHP